MFLAFGSLAVVVGPAQGVRQGGERGQEERAFQLLVAAFGWVFSADAGARSARDWRQAGVGGQVAGGGERGDVADFEQDPGCGPDPDAGDKMIVSPGKSTATSSTSIGFE